MLITPKMNIQYPMALERDYAKQLQTYVHKLTAICIRHIPNMVDAIMLNSIRTDDWTEETTDDIERDINEELSILAVILAMFNRVHTFSVKQQDKVFKSVFGSIPKNIPKSEIDKIKRIWVDQNLSLIKSIEQRTMESIRYSLSRNIIKTVDKEMLVEELTDSIKQMAHVNENRAALIACDQVGKLNGQLAELEQMNQGNKYYQWSTMKDSRVRPAHSAREGKIYAWDDPPSDGHPGWAIRCRCVAKPVYDTDKFGLKPQQGSYKTTGEYGIIKGRTTGALDPTSERADAHAERYYASVRAMKTDVARIAKNTGFSQEDVQKVKNYVFYEKHDLGSEGVRRFDASYSMAESWRRLIDGRDIKPHDLLLIKHELIERALMKSGVSQQEAHALASKDYNYAKEAFDYHAKISGRKKNK